ncbi:hypothetical protein B566_EDAN002346 [Ephemera danica]|nr:hypothetical protein B566_EDAN002346 [Ephemera danica]
MERWTGRVALVTGANSGIGAAVTRLFVENGMKVAGVDLDITNIQTMASELTANSIYPVKADVTREDDVINAVKWTRDNLGGADVLVNCAGIFHQCALTEFHVERTRKMFEVNVFGLCMFTREVVNDIRDRGIDDGHIFNICSIAGQMMMSKSDFTMYCASKHAVRVFSEGLRQELRNLGTKIRVTNMSPGIVHSNLYSTPDSGIGPEAASVMFTRNPTLQPQDVAKAILYALSAPPDVQVHELTIRPTGELVF